MSRGTWSILTGLLLLAGWQLAPSALFAQQIPYYPGYQLSRYYYYPYQYYPHNYWPITGPRWPEPAGAAYMRPPAYMAYPAFREPNWRYDLWNNQKYYRGFHFWLDQF